MGTHVLFRNNLLSWDRIFTTLHQRSTAAPNYTSLVVKIVILHSKRGRPPLLAPRVEKSKQRSILCRPPGKLSVTQGHDFNNLWIQWKKKIFKTCQVLAIPTGSLPEQCWWNISYSHTTVLIFAKFLYYLLSVHLTKSFESTT